MEHKKLKDIIDKFFESYTSRSYIKPELTKELAEEVNEWYPVNIPGEIVIFRKSGFANLEQGYEGEQPVVRIIRKTECTNKTY